MENWKRPAVLKPPVPEKDPIIFQQIDVDHYTVAHSPIIRLFGVTRDGHSINCRVHGFRPYFYFLIKDVPDQPKLERFKKELNAKLASQAKNPETILDVKHLVKKSIYGYDGDKERNFLKITVSVPEDISKTSTALKQLSDTDAFLAANPCDPGDQPIRLFESNIEYKLRFMVDKKIFGCSWITLPPGSYKLNNGNFESTCQIECDVDVDNLISHAPEGQWANVALLRTLSYDIECANREGVFPDPQQDAVIQIGNVVVKQGAKEPFIKCIFTLGSCAPIAGAVIKSYESEEEMLLAWTQFVRDVDPDIITGYNIQNFDFGYLLDRAIALKIEKFPYLSRIKNSETKARKVTLQSQQLGRRENLDINIEGRVIFDLILVLRRDYKLRSYSLNAVSYHFLQEQKEDVHHSIITTLFKGNEQTRRRLAVYCLKDALLPIKLIEKLMCVVFYMEMARVTGVPLGYLLTRGQQIKVVSQILRKSTEQNYLMPTMIPKDGDEFSGALVIDPTKGYYDVPIATLDFASLYPSIMMAHNLCYTTFLPRPTHARMKDRLKEGEHFIETPAKFLFIKADVKKGLLPDILDDLLSARKKAKDDLKKETDPFKKQVLDGRQLALKISANSVYGFTGAQVGKLPCLEISQSVTAFGREMIEATKEAVLGQFTKENGYPHDAQVIYGDTDSVMVKFGVQTVAEAMELGREAAAFVTSKFIRPIKLEFEKVYFPYLLINKKRYAGLYWSKPNHYDKMDCKGIETVRRDNCTLVANLINTCLERILMKRDPNGAIEHAKHIISDLLRNKVDISHLVITKEYSKDEKEYKGKQAHVELVNRIKARDPAGTPKIGDRIPYVIIAAGKGTPAYMKSEDPLYVLENSIPIDTRYYLENQLSKPLLRIFEPILGEKAESVLLKGDHTLTKTVVTSKVGALSNFTKKRNKCIGCKSVLDDDSLAVCKYCEDKESGLYLENLDELNELEVKYSRLWTQCQRCQGNLHEEVICTSCDCPIFYMRKKVQKDLTAHQKLMQRFGVPAW
ncbi:DNA polymerase delta catalytic subunit, partial [Fragariocoptes setiger]